VLGGSVSNGGTEAYVRIKEKRPACFRGRDEGVGVAGDKGTTMPAEYSRTNIQTITWRVDRAWQTGKNSRRRRCS